MKQDFTLAAAGNPELPPNSDPNLRWVAARKLAVVLHVLDQEHGLLKTKEAAIEHYSSTKLSIEELDDWIEKISKSQGSLKSLMSTKIRTNVLEANFH